jgi:hypothetical protein
MRSLRPDPREDGRARACSRASRNVRSRGKPATELNGPTGKAKAVHHNPEQGSLADREVDAPRRRKPPDREGFSTSAATPTRPWWPGHRRPPRTHFTLYPCGYEQHRTVQAVPGRCWTFPVFRPPEPKVIGSSPIGRTSQSTT